MQNTQLTKNACELKNVWLSHLLYFTTTPSAYVRSLQQLFTHHNAYTTGVKNVQFKVVAFLPDSLLSPRASLDLYVGCYRNNVVCLKCMPKETKCCLEWNEFIWFNFDTETMHRDAKTHTHTHKNARMQIPCPCRFMCILEHIHTLDKWHNTNDMTTI